MRRKQLLKTAERLAQARAKAAAPPAPAPTPPAVSSAVEAPAPPRALAASPPTPLHPSLPAKPGTTPVIQSTSSSENLSASTSAPKRTSTPAPAPSPPAPAPAQSAEPTPIILPPDDQIQKYEEVSSFVQSIACHCPYSDQHICVTRANNVGLGWLSGQHEINTCNISAKLAQAISSRWRWRLKKRRKKRKRGRSEKKLQLMKRGCQPPL